ncbi:hypothetical protein GCM10017674_75290 [Streptomyces gardneri]|uniref:Uncharacterized protein n=1 Tax=Streptomyces gardneri TaxID=66892 RepID=A0A4Y3RQV4_9ACTN|nr:hypothetical protein SGA01_55570 [Streptomyces gardneri]GHH20950.1 hypothetical protein GCM10017674_75290 [Streptomyces gardneri]
MGQSLTAAWAGAAPAPSRPSEVSPSATAVEASRRNRGVRINSLPKRGAYAFSKRAAGRNVPVSASPLPRGSRAEFDPRPARCALVPVRRIM